MCGSFTNGLPVKFLTGQTMEDVADVVDTSFLIIDDVTDLSDASVFAYPSRMRFEGRTQIYTQSKTN